MEPGPDRYLACPRCGAVSRHDTFLSGNTFGAVLWSDGKEVAPMLPEPPIIARCAKCEGYYWLRQAREIGCFYGFEGEEGFPPECQDAPRLVEPDSHAYLELVRAGFALNRDDERTLRLFAWHRRNDSLRTSPDDLDWDAPGWPTQPPTDPLEDDEYRENLEALLALLDDDSEHGHLFRAAVLRTLGRFEEALGVINRVQWDRLAELAFQMGIWCKRRDASLRAFERSP